MKRQSTWSPDGPLTLESRQLQMWWPVLPLKTIALYLGLPRSTIRSRAVGLHLPPKARGPQNKSGRVYPRRGPRGDRNAFRARLKPGDREVYDALRSRGESHASALAWLTR